MYCCHRNGKRVIYRENDPWKTEFWLQSKPMTVEMPEDIEEGEILYDDLDATTQMAVTNSQQFTQPNNQVLMKLVKDERRNNLIEALIIQLQHLSVKVLRKERKNKELWRRMKDLKRQMEKKQKNSQETSKNFERLVTQLENITVDLSKSNIETESMKDIVDLEGNSYSKARLRSRSRSPSREMLSSRYRSRKRSRSRRRFISKSSSSRKSRSKRRSSLRSSRKRSQSKSSSSRSRSSSISFSSRSRSRERHLSRRRSRSSYSSSPFSEPSYSKAFNFSRKSKQSNNKKDVYKEYRPCQQIDVYRKRSRSRSEYSSSSSSSPPRKRENKTLARSVPYDDSRQTSRDNSQNPYRKSTRTTETESIRQGSNILTKQTVTTVTTVNYGEELKNFKDKLKQSQSDSDESDGDRKSKDIDILVCNKKGKDVTSIRPDGNLNHPFYIHPEDVELYRVRLKKNTPPLQAFHEICIKSGWNFPSYSVRQDHLNLFIYEMKLNGHKFTTTKRAQQKKMAQAKLAKVFLQWSRVIDI